MASKMRSWMTHHEAQKVHLQMMCVIRELQRLNNAQPWLEGWQVASQQPQPAPAPVAAPTSKAASSSSLPIKAAPSSRAPMSQSPSMASAPRNSSFPSEQGADPWAKHLSNQKRALQHPKVEPAAVLHPDKECEASMS